jgi:hypothetical protein
MLKKRSSNKKSYCTFIWLNYLIDLEFFVLKIGYVMNDNSIGLFPFHCWFLGVSL